MSTFRHDYGLSPGLLIRPDCDIEVPISNWIFDIVHYRGPGPLIVPTTDGQISSFLTGNLHNEVVWC